MLGLDSPDRQRTALLALLLVGGAVLFHRYVWTPVRDERAAVETHLARLERTNRQARAATQPERVSELRQQERAYEIALAGYEEMLPERTQAMALLAGISAAALSADVQIVSFAPRQEILGEDLVEMPFDVQVQGGYHGLGRFLAEVINLPQLVRPEVQAIEGVRARDPVRALPEHQVLGTLVLSAYALDDRVGPTSTGSAATPTYGTERTARVAGRTSDDG